MRAAATQQLQHVIAKILIGHLVIIVALAKLVVLPEHLIAISGLYSHVWVWDHRPFRG